MIESKDIDIEIMNRVLKLAENGTYTTKPNPRVGTIIARGSKILAESWHTAAGDAHAEIKALEIAGDDSRGADLYVNLEPCSHTGLTPPCAPALIGAGIRRVVIAMKDPNPEVAGKGIKLLKKAGVHLTVGTRENIAQELNKGFVTRMLTGLPFVRLKLAATVDGRTAAPDGTSQWITSPDARQDVHHWRAASSAVVTGMGTIVSDNPRLNARVNADVIQPLRVILDGNGRLNSDAALFAVEGPILIVTSPRSDHQNYTFDDRTEIMHLPDKDGRIDLKSLLLELGKRGCNDVLIEAGAALAGDFATSDLVDEYLLYVAPDILGNESRGMFILPGLAKLSDRISLEIVDTERLGRDLRIRLRPKDRS